MKTLHGTCLKPVALLAALLGCAAVSPAIAESKVFLELKVKVNKDWRKDEEQLKQFGYLNR